MSGHMIVPWLMAAGKEVHYYSLITFGMYRWRKGDPNSYDAAHDSPTGAYDALQTYPHIGQRYLALPSWVIWRDQVGFNTGAVSSEWNLVKVVLSLYGYANQSVVDFDLTVVNGENIRHDNYGYGDLLNKTLSGGQINTANFAYEFMDITLNATGRSWIKPGDLTYLGLRSSYDIDASPPLQDPSMPEFIRVVGYHGPYDERPRLHIYYTL